MGRETKIQWAHHTFNPWRGCTKVSAGCDHCYADVQSYRNPKVLGIWGKNGTRVVAANDYWRQPVQWDREAAEAGERRRVFCASLADVFEGPSTLPTGALSMITEARIRLFKLIDDTPNLDWLLLTKRPKNIRRFWSWPERRHNVWLGTSIENQSAADKRVGPLLECRPMGPVIFLSIEPLIGPVVLPEEFLCPDFAEDDERNTKRWVIIGGESGGNARPCNVRWVRSLVHQCASFGVPCFVKQMGARVILPNDRASEWGRGGDVLSWEDDEGYTSYQGEEDIARLEDDKGGDPDEWPEDLRVRQLPTDTEVTHAPHQNHR